MYNLLNKDVEAYSQEEFQCGHCNKEFKAKVATWVDVSRSPHIKTALLKWHFNIIKCTYCGCSHFSGTPFFYEDFEEGLLVAVFPRIPDNRGMLEASIKEKYGYYPVLEFFYDMTQIWALIYFQEHYKKNKNLRSLSRIGNGEARLRAFLRFLKEDQLMIEIREKLTESFFGDITEDELVELLGRAIYTIEGMLPWPMDRLCVCGADLSEEFKCCGIKINLYEHERLLSRHYVIYCPGCKESLAGASCEECGRVYTWKLGVVDSIAKEYEQQRKEAVAPTELRVEAVENDPLNVQCMAQHKKGGDFSPPC